MDAIFSTKENKYFEYCNEVPDVPRLKNIHDNMKVIINENGHLFLINRLSNKVYFFFKNAS
jgi:hypothetical protein